MTIVQLFLDTFTDPGFTIFLISEKDKATPNLHASGAKRHPTQHNKAGHTFYLRRMCCHVTCLIAVKSVTTIGCEW